ncbi:hypothetical protein AKL22_02925 [Carnobacterium maltaromaticum]|nr:hypothetical protein [Carnobacterium maltaromaticum]
MLKKFGCNNLNIFNFFSIRKILEKIIIVKKITDLDVESNTTPMTGLKEMTKETKLKVKAILLISFLFK